MHLPTVVVERLRVHIDENTHVVLLLLLLLLLLRFDFWRGEVGRQFGVCGYAEAVEHVFGNRHHAHERVAIAGFGDETQRAFSCVL